MACSMTETLNGGWRTNGKTAKNPHASCLLLAKPAWRHWRLQAKAWRLNCCPQRSRFQHWTFYSASRLQACCQHAALKLYLRRCLLNLLELWQTVPRIIRMPIQDPDRHCMHVEHHNQNLKQLFLFRGRGRIFAEARIRKRLRAVSRAVCSPSVILKSESTESWQRGLQLLSHSTDLCLRTNPTILNNQLPAPLPCR